MTNEEIENFSRDDEEKCLMVEERKMGQLIVQLSYFRSIPDLPNHENRDLLLNFLVRKLDTRPWKLVETYVREKWNYQY